MPLRSEPPEQGIEKMMYKTRLGVVKQLEKHMKSEETMREELRIAKERSNTLARELRAEQNARKRSEALASRVTKDMEIGSKIHRESEAYARNELAARSDALAAREASWKDDEIRYRRELEKERSLRRKLEDSLSKITRKKSFCEVD